ncbi:hypothetical protein BN8_p06802 (plasmid) [Fibrisoma limi BUZ 3]|uniref:Uncharacterized protein n=1 Tax=Fibrisoma limi BUZ 3 TaxID=1185876 RepID=I2GU05_9BACT|nr:hypothetical protein [Fibrisoma limi]CCH57606.1 hypothetical protein BN8_p06802 [Fibrisoma limi BUZ 3]
MKPFNKTNYFKWIAPLIYRMLPAIPARYFWCLFIASALLVQFINIICSFWNGFLGEPADHTVRYYAFIVVETVRYGGWLWGFWYGFYLLARMSPPNRLLSPQLFSCTVTSGLLMYLMTVAIQHVEADYLLLIRCMLIVAYGVCVLLPTLWHPVQAD